MEILSEDPLFKNSTYMKSLVGKTVKIDTDESLSYTGTVYVIDPIYKTVILHCQKEGSDKQNTVFILRHAIKSLEVLPNSLNQAYLEERNKSQLMVDSETEKRRLKKWLQQRLISIQDKGEYLKMDDHLVILPPYTIENCICNNTIVLEKIRNIIQMMPTDFS